MYCNNIINENDFDLIANVSNDYTFEDYNTANQKGFGVILCFKIFYDAKSSTVVDAKDFEKKLNMATIQKYDNDVQKLTRDIKTIQKDIKHLEPNPYRTTTSSLHSSFL